MELLFYGDVVLLRHITGKVLVLQFECKDKQAIDSIRYIFRCISNFGCRYSVLLHIHGVHLLGSLTAME